MTKEEAAAAEKQEETKPEEKKEETPKDATEPAEQKEGETETKAEGEGEENAEGEGKDGEDKGKGGKRGRKWPWSRKGGAPGGAQTTAAAENGTEEGGEGSGGEQPEEPEKPPPTDQEMEQELNKKVKELTVVKNTLSSRIELYKKCKNLEQEVEDMKGELDSLKEARGLPTSSEANKPYALRPGR